MVDIIEYSIEMRKKKALIFYKHRRQKNIKRKRKLQPHNITGMHLLHLHCGPLTRFQIFTFIRI